MRMAVFLLLVCVVATGQTSSTLRQKYGQPTSETYNVRPNIKVTVTYAKTAEICEMLIQPIAETENGKPSLLKSQPLAEVIDELVPKEQRGKYLMGTFLNIICLPNNDCFGVEENYEKVLIHRHGSTDAHPYASIHWKTHTCARLDETNAH
jgi:hypothetical protein